MALMKCPECKKKVSDQCETCPHCGYSIQKYLASKETEGDASAVSNPAKKSISKKTLIILIAASVVLLAIITIICCVAFAPGEATPNSSETTSTTLQTEAATEETAAQETPTTQPEETLAKEIDIFSYCGIYMGNAFLEISSYEEDSFGVYYDVANHDGSRTASFYVDVPIASIENGKVEFSFCDSWYNTGTMVLVFEENFIAGNITIEEHSSSAMYSVRAGDDEFYPMELENSGDPGEALDPDSAFSAGIQFGDLFFDNVEYDLPVSLSQIEQDIYQNEINKFYVDSTKIAFDIAYLLPIKGAYDKRTDFSEYTIWMHAYFTNGAVTYNTQFKMEYTYYDIGGWVFSGSSSVKKREVSGTLTTPFCPPGKKSGNFSYEDYPSGLPISMGELADDILYAELHYIKVDGACSYFNLDSIQVISGEYWENEYHEALDLRVIINYSNDTHTGYADLELTYYYYDAGDWELSSNYYKEGGIRESFPTSEIQFQPKTMSYSDTEFLKKAADYFTSITQTDESGTINADGETVQTITYTAVRDTQYLKEYYEIILTARFSGAKWRESADIALVSVDYSNLLGLWEYKLGEEFIRINIKDISCTIDPKSWKQGISTTTITYDYECSNWGADAYTQENATEKIKQYQSVFEYDNKQVSFYRHFSPLASISEYAGRNDDRGRSISIGLDQTTGIFISSSIADWLGVTEDAVFNKIA